MAAKPKVVLVLGDPAFATAMGKYFTVRGFEPHLVKTATAALDVIKETKPVVVVASQLLPGMDGPALTRQIRAANLTVPVVLIAAVTSNAGVHDVERVSGADAVLPANFQPETLLTIVRRAAAGEPLADTFKNKSPSPSKEDTASMRVAKAASAPGASDAHSAAQRALELEAQIVGAKPVGGTPKPVESAPYAVARSSQPQIAIDPAYLLSRAFADGVTGSLRFVSGGAERTVYFNQGRPIVVTSNVPEERIGQILIRKGKITAKELDIAMRQVETKGKRLAQIIVGMGVMTEREHDEELAEQYAERVLAIFAWHEASIEFTATPPPQELVQIRLSPERLVLEGLRRHYDAARLEAALFDPNRVLRLAPDANARVPFLQLEPLEAAVLVLIDGKRPLAELLKFAPARREALRAIYASLCLGIVT